MRAKLPLVMSAAVLLGFGAVADAQNVPPKNSDRHGVIGGVVRAEQQKAGKRASDWTLDERLAKRSDPTLAHERSSAAHAKVTTGAGRHVVDVISGKTHPELFLPHELFENVVAGGFLDPGWRRAYKPLAQEAGLPPDFWDRLETIAGPYIADLRARQSMSAERASAGRVLSMGDHAALDQQLCHDRAQALVAARAAFGRTLDHFMYEYVAPTRTDYLTTLSDAQTLRAQEGGCK